MPFPAIIPQLPDRKWNISIFIIELFLFAPLLHYFPYDHLPAPGWAVAFIAVAAALMSIHDKMTGVQRAGWMLLIAFLLVIELRAISKDRSINEEAQKTDREEERRSFQNLLKQEASNNHDLLQFADERFLQITNTQ